MNSKELQAAKADYYLTMVDVIHATSEHAHWKAAQHLEATAIACIRAGECLDDGYVKYIQDKCRVRALSAQLIRHRPVDTIRQLREAIADLPDDLPLIKTQGGRNVVCLDVYVNRWVFSSRDGQSVEDFAVRIG